MSRVALVLGVAALALAPPAKAQADFTLEPAPELSSLSLPAGLADRLEARGSRVVRTANGGHQPVCDVWWVKSLTLNQGAPAAAGVLYGALPAGSLVGLLRFLSSDAEDFRDQKLKPAFYTMRYARVAPGSDETGLGQYEDFLALIPMGADAHAGQTLAPDELFKLSSTATGTGHPALMSLVPANPAYKRLPAVVADDLGNCALQAALPAGSGSGLVLSVLLVTPLKDEGGS